LVATCLENDQNLIDTSLENDLDKQIACQGEQILVALFGHGQLLLG
jgi:hypothetical protein